MIVIRLSQWKQIIQNCRDSGLPVKRWCDENNIQNLPITTILKSLENWQ